MSKFNAVLLTSLLNSIIPELPLALMVFHLHGQWHCTFTGIAAGIHHITGFTEVL